MNFAQLMRGAAFCAVAPIAALGVAGLAHAAPGAGDSCQDWHATTQDGDGKTMWCNHTMTGLHNLVWQYGGPSDISGPSSARPEHTDAQGFLDQPAARCNGQDLAYVMARTTASLIVLCKSEDGHYYYKGLGEQNGLSVQIDNPVQIDGGFSVTNNGVQYTLTSKALTATRGSDVIGTEPMMEYWAA